MASSEGKIAGAITGLMMAVVFAFVIVPEINDRDRERMHAGVRSMPSASEPLSAAPQPVDFNAAAGEPQPIPVNRLVPRSPPQSFPRLER
jgi:hypothetical protein